MEAVLTGDVMDGPAAVASGYANRSVAGGDLDTETLRLATRIAAVPDEVTQLNKRSVHRDGAFGDGRTRSATEE